LRALKEGEPLAENASIEMARTAQALLDPRLGNTGTRLAWAAMRSPEAINAALTQVAIELIGQTAGEVAGKAIGGLLAARRPAFRAATRVLAGARAAGKEIDDLVERVSLERIIAEAEEIIAQAYRPYPPAEQALKHITRVFVTDRLEGSLEQKEAGTFAAPTR
jgi:hypothetical protein